MFHVEIMLTDRYRQISAVVQHELDISSLCAIHVCFITQHKEKSKHVVCQRHYQLINI